MPPRVPPARPDRSTTTGNLGFAGGGPNLQLLDGSPRDLWARITDRISANKYGFTRLDDGDGGTFADFSGATECSDGDAIVAYEVGGRADVPVGAKVRISPNITGPGYTFEYQSGPTNPADGSCAGVGWTAALTAADCVTVSELSAGGLCACASFAAFTLSSADGQTWATAAPGGGVPAFTLCGTAGYAFAFRRGTGCDSRPCLTITGPAVGSGAAPTYSGVLECGGCNYAVFAFSAPVLCTGTRADTGPCDNLLRVKVEWTCCPVAGWAGAGWYCAKGADSPTACVAVELLDSDKCDGTITICSGPYATQSEAEAVCGGDPNTPMPCQSKSFASATASFANKTGDCTCLPDSPTVGATGVDSCTIATAGCPGNVGLTLSCSGGQYALTSTGGLTITPVYFSAGPPLVLAWDVTGYGVNCGAGGGGARLVITVP